MQTNTVTCLDPAAVSDVGACGGGLPGDTGQSAILDCSSGVVRCSGEGRATDCCHGSQSVVALTSPVGSTIARVGQLGHVVQVSSSPLITNLHNHQISGTQ